MTFKEHYITELKSKGLSDSQAEECLTFAMGQDHTFASYMEKNIEDNSKSTLMIANTLFRQCMVLWNTKMQPHTWAFNTGATK